MARVSVSERFVGKRNEVASQRVRDKIDAAIINLSIFPQMGTALVLPSVRLRFGQGVRKVTVAPHQLIYEYDANNDIVYILDLLFSPAIS